jgi:hypothetical protein
MSKLRWTLPLLVVGCSFPLVSGGDTYTLYGPERMDPPLEYRLAFEAAEECVDFYLAAGMEGRKRPGATLESVDWWSAKLISRNQSAWVAGMWIKSDNRIIISEAWLDDLNVVIHESLHHLLHPITHGMGVFWVCDPFRIPFGR